MNSFSMAPENPDTREQCEETKRLWENDNALTVCDGVHIILPGRYSMLMDNGNKMYLQSRRAIASFFVPESCNLRTEQ